MSQLFADFLNDETAIMTYGASSENKGPDDTERILAAIAALNTQQRAIMRELSTIKEILAKFELKQSTL